MKRCFLKVLFAFIFVLVVLLNIPTAKAMSGTVEDELIITDDTTISSGELLSFKSGSSLTINEGCSLIIDGGTLQIEQTINYINNGTLVLNSNENSELIYIMQEGECTIPDFGVVDELGNEFDCWIDLEDNLYEIDSSYSISEEVIISPFKKNHNYIISKIESKYQVSTIDYQVATNLSSMQDAIDAIDASRMLSKKPSTLGDVSCISGNTYTGENGCNYFFDGANYYADCVISFNNIFDNVTSDVACNYITLSNGGYTLSGILDIGRTNRKVGDKAFYYNGGSSLAFFDLTLTVQDMIAFYNENGDMKISNSSILIEDTTVDENEILDAYIIHNNKTLTIGLDDSSDKVGTITEDEYSNYVDSKGTVDYKTIIRFSCPNLLLPIEQRKSMIKSNSGIVNIYGGIFYCSYIDMFDLKGDSVTIADGHFQGEINKSIFLEASTMKIQYGLFNNSIVVSGNGNFTMNGGYIYTSSGLSLCNSGNNIINYGYITSKESSNAIMIDGDGYTTINNGVFKNNSNNTGAAFYLKNGSAAINGGTFYAREDNENSNSIVVDSRCILYIKNCNFERILLKGGTNDEKASVVLSFNNQQVMKCSISNNSNIAGELYAVIGNKNEYVAIDSTDAIKDLSVNVINDSFAFSGYKQEIFSNYFAETQNAAPESLSTKINDLVTTCGSGKKSVLISFDRTYKVNVDNGVDVTSIDAFDNIPFSLAQPVRQGYTFLGYTLEGNNPNYNKANYGFSSESVMIPITNDSTLAIIENGIGDIYFINLSEALSASGEEVTLKENWIETPFDYRIVNDGSYFSVYHIFLDSEYLVKNKIASLNDAIELINSERELGSIKPDSVEEELIDDIYSYGDYYYYEEMWYAPCSIIFGKDINNDKVFTNEEKLIIEDFDDNVGGILNKGTYLLYGSIHFTFSEENYADLLTVFQVENNSRVKYYMTTYTNEIGVTLLSESYLYMLSGTIEAGLYGIFFGELTPEGTITKNAYLFLGRGVLDGYLCDIAGAIVQPIIANDGEDIPYYYDGDILSIAPMADRYDERYEIPENGTIIVEGINENGDKFVLAKDIVALNYYYNTNGILSLRQINLNGEEVLYINYTIFNVTLVENGGYYRIGYYEPTMYCYPEALILPTGNEISCPGKVFLGWTEYPYRQDETNPYISDFYEYGYGDKVLYAQWGTIIKFFDGEEDISSLMSGDMYYIEGYSYTLPEYYIDSNTLILGWTATDDEDDVDYITSISTESTGEKHFYVKYKTVINDIVDPHDDEKTYGTLATVSVSATVIDGFSLSYQWYYNSSNSMSGGTIIDGANEDTYTIVNASDYYYYCVISAGEYFVTTQTSHVVVNKKDVTINAKATDRKYDGLTNVSIVLENYTINGKIDTDDLNIDNIPLTGSILSADVGNDKEVTLDSDFSLNGDDLSNYNLIQPTLTVNISKASVEIITETYEVPYAEKPLSTFACPTLSVNPDIEGIFSWENEDIVLNEGDNTVNIVFNPSSDNYEEITVEVTVKASYIYVNYHSMGSGEDYTDEIIYEETYHIRIEEYSKEGKKQIGWSTSSDGLNEYEFSCEYVAIDNLDLYPVWEDKTYIYHVEMISEKYYIFGCTNEDNSYLVSSKDVAYGVESVINDIDIDRNYNDNEYHMATIRFYDCVVNETIILKNGNYTIIGSLSNTSTEGDIPAIILVDGGSTVTFTFESHFETSDSDASIVDVLNGSLFITGGTYTSKGKTIIIGKNGLLNISDNPIINSDLYSIEIDTNINCIIDDDYSGEQLVINSSSSENNIIVAKGEGNPSTDKWQLKDNYPIWELKLDDSGNLIKSIIDFTITYYDQGENDEIPYSGDGIDFAYDSYQSSEYSFILPEGEKEGYRFDGWYDSYTGGVRIIEIPGGTDGEKCYYAKWVKQGSIIEAKYYEQQIWNSLINPTLPLDGYLISTYDLENSSIEWNDGDYVMFEMAYDSVIDIADDTIRNNIISSLLLLSSSNQADIENAMVVKMIQYNSLGQKISVLSNIGLIWGIGDKGFVYTTLDSEQENSVSSYFVSYDARTNKDVVRYSATSNNFATSSDISSTIIDSEGDNHTPIDTHVVFAGRVVNSLNEPLSDMDIRIQYNGEEYTLVTDENGYFEYTVTYQNEVNVYDVYISKSPYGELSYQKMIGIDEEKNTYVYTNPEEDGTGDYLKYTLTFDTNYPEYGTITPNSFDAIYGSFIEVMVNMLIINGTTIQETSIGNAEYDYVFTGWEINEYTVTGEQTIKAIYKQVAKNYEVVSSSDSGASNYVDGYWSYNEEVAFNINILTGYEFESVRAYKTGNETVEVELTGDIINGWSFMMPSFNVTIEATTTKKEYSLVYDVNGGNELTIEQLEGKEDYDIDTIDFTLPVPTKTGYDFVGWFISTSIEDEDINGNPLGTYTEYCFGTDFMNSVIDGYELIELLYANLDDDGLGEENAFSSTNIAFYISMDGEGSLIAKWKPSINTSYKVEHYYENLDGTYSINNSKTQYLTGVTNEEVEAISNTETSYEFDSSISDNVLSGIVLPDGSLTLKLYYSREIYEIKWYNGVTLLDTSHTKYGVTLEYTEDTPTYSDSYYLDYTFSGWKIGEETYGLDDELPISIKNTFVYAIFTKGELVSYHQEFNVNGGEVNDGQDSYIYDDESGYYKLEYDYENHTVPEGKEDDYFYLAMLNVERTGYVFDGWFRVYNEKYYGNSIGEFDSLDDEALNIDSSISGVESNTYSNYLFIAKWKPSTNTSYKVEHYYENLDGTYSINNSKIQYLKGVTDEEVEAISNTETSYEFDSSISNNVLSGIVLADGSLTLKLYYSYKKYTVTFVNYNDSIISGASVKYGLTATYNGNKPIRPADGKYTYEFNGWDKKLGVVTDNITYKAIYRIVEIINDNEEKIIIPIGVEEYVELVIDKVNNTNITTPKNYEVLDSYNASLRLVVNENVTDEVLTPKDVMTISMSVPLDYNEDEITIVMVDEEGNQVRINPKIENGKLTFKTSRLGDFVIVKYDDNLINLLWLIILLIIIGCIELVTIGLLYVKNRKNNIVVESSVTPLILFGLVEGQLELIITLIVIDIIACIIILLLVLSTKKRKEKIIAFEQQNNSDEIKGIIEIVKKEDSVDIVSKKIIADHLMEVYGKEIIINRRDNSNKYGLPLADTYYLVKDDSKRCFCYTYEIDGKNFMLIKCKQKTAKKISSRHNISLSKFPKSAEPWYSLIIDDTFKDKKEVYEIIQSVITDNI